MQGQISYDLVMDDDMPFVEGTYRLVSGDVSGEWHVFIFIFSKIDAERPQWNQTAWPSGVEGLVFWVPASMTLNMASVEDLMGQALSVQKWERVQGPDSMVLR